MRSKIFLFLGLLVGLVVGSAVNMGLITLGASIIPPPEGVDMNHLEIAISSFEFKHFVFPFFAHALGTFTGVYVASLFIKENGHRFIPFFVISLLFLIGGVIMVFQLPAPVWFEITDLVLAYIPMGWMGYRLVYSSNK